MNNRASNFSGSSSSNRRGQAPSSLSISSSNTQAASSAAVLLPNGISAQVKQTISLEEWERKAPLSDLQVRSVAKVAKASEHIPLPLKFMEDSSRKSPPGTPIPVRPINKHLQQNLDISRPATPAITRGTHALHPSHSIQTPQQFYDWFALVDRSVAHSQEAHYRAHLASLDEQLSVCDLLLNRLEKVENEVEGMLEGWRGVEEGGKNLKGACERLLGERDGLLQLMEDIGSHLEYFQELEHATRMLNHPGESLIFQADFHYMVERVDICIEFLKGHRHYREADLYLLRFQQCMTRAMTLIKMNFLGSLRALTSEVSKLVSQSDVSSTAQHHLLYTRFKTVSAKVAPLIGELERRVQEYPEELGSLLSECHSAYFSTRKALVAPRVMEEIKGLDPARSELVELTRSGCSYLKQLCTDEFNLYREFFATAQDQLYRYLEVLCDLLYDDLRPRILHEPRLTVLCEVCTVLQALMVLDATSTSVPTATLTVASRSHLDDDDVESDSEGETRTSAATPEKLSQARRRSLDELTVSRHGTDAQSRLAKGDKIGRRLHIGQLLKMVLQDAQTRLFFKAQSVVQSDIRHYVPSVDDLKWPDILVAASDSPPSALLQEKQSISQIFHNVPALERQDTWYPTLQRTVWVLSQLRDFVKPAIFEDIAQETLAVCRVSLVNASDLIKTQQGKALDGALFLVRHLLILKDILVSLESDLRNRTDENGAGGYGDVMRKTSTRRTTLEFGGLATTVGGTGGVTETITNILSKTTALLPEGLFASLGVTSGIDNDLRGVKTDIDQSLRKAFEDVITSCSQPINEPLETWLKLVNGSKEPTGTIGSASVIPSAATSARAPPSTTTSGAVVPQPNPNTVVLSAPQIQSHFLEALHRDLQSAATKVKYYLDDQRTVKILLEHVVDRIEAMYERFGDMIFTVKKAGVGSEMGEVEILSSSKLREILRDACGDATLSFPGFSKA